MILKCKLLRFLLVVLVNVRRNVTERDGLRHESSKKRWDKDGVIDIDVEVKRRNGQRTQSSEKVMTIDGNGLKENHLLKQMCLNEDQHRS